MLRLRRPGLEDILLKKCVQRSLQLRDARNSPVHLLPRRLQCVPLVPVQLLDRLLDFLLVLQKGAQHLL